MRREGDRECEVVVREAVHSLPRHRSTSYSNASAFPCRGGEEKTKREKGHTRGGWIDALDNKERDESLRENYGSTAKRGGGRQGVERGGAHSKGKPSRAGRVRQQRHTHRHTHTPTTLRNK